MHDEQYGWMHECWEAMFVLRAWDLRFFSLGSDCWDLCFLIFSARRTGMGAADMAHHY